MDDLRRLTETTLNSFGKIDILINNAGVFIENDFFEASEEDYDKTMDVIVKGTFFLTQMVAKSMVERGIRGRIVNISSAATGLVRGMPVDYCAAKSAVNTMTKALSSALGKYGITVNGIAPGPIPTKINKWQFDDPKIRETLREATTLKEFGDTRYIANAVRYFLTEDAKWTTGALLQVDGGASV
jgi:NAD(P)-dependent dehydrogenase (short-subunit alcohol dehydrogenase family)